DVERDHAGPEVPLAQFFAVHAARPFGQPVVGARVHAEQRTSHHHIMEVGDHVIGIVHGDIDRRHGQDQAGKAAYGEHEDKANGEQHGGFEGHGPAPHGGNPVKHLHARGYGNEHGGVHEVQLTRYRHAGGEHVVSPDQEGQNGNGCGGVHHGSVAKQLFAGEGGYNSRHDTEGRQNHHIDFGVTEEPEHVLIQNGVTTGGGVKEG